MQTRFADLTERLGPVLTAVTAAFLMLLGLLVIAYPAVLRWLVGGALLLAGVSVVASLVTTLAVGSRSDR